MLEQMIESKSHIKENKTRGGFFLTTFFIMIAFCFSAVLSSLFAMNLVIGEDFELSSLVAPVMAEIKPEPVKPQKNQTETKTDAPVRQANMLRVDESWTSPDKISVVPNTQKERPKGDFKLGDKDRDSVVPQDSFTRETGGNEAGGITDTKISENIEKDDSPDLKKSVAADKKVLKTTRVSGGVVNGQATFLPKPAYPAPAKLVKAQGEVSVQILIDKNGNVVSAKAVTGHTLLRAESEKAARNAKFKPTKLSGEPVEVTGIIIYKFTP